MESLALSVYCLSLVVLLVKFAVAISLQASQRLRSRRFQYAEDAAFWDGEVAPDTELCVRAQRLLRNDTESQVFYFVLGGAYLALGAWPTGAPYYFGLYTASRVAHAGFLLGSRQPHRNRAFAVGVLVLLILAGHVAYEAVLRLAA